MHPSLASQNPPALLGGHRALLGLSFSVLIKIESIVILILTKPFSLVNKTRNFNSYNIFYTGRFLSFLNLPSAYGQCH